MYSLEDISEGSPLSQKTSSKNNPKKRRSSQLLRRSSSGSENDDVFAPPDNGARTNPFNSANHSDTDTTVSDAQSKVSARTARYYKRQKIKHPFRGAAASDIEPATTDDNDMASQSTSSTSAFSTNGDVTDLSDSDVTDIEAQIKTRSAKQREKYQKYKGTPFKLNTSSGLQDIVLKAETAKNASANTTLLYRGPDSDQYVLLQKDTASAVKALIGRFRISRAAFPRRKPIEIPHIDIQAKAAKSALGENVHTEMYLLWMLTDGFKKSHVGVLKGYKLVVDKPSCQDCFKLLKEAGLEILRDGTAGISDTAPRQQWAKWKLPGNGKPKAKL